MENPDWEAKWQNILDTNDFSDITDPTVGISLAEIIQAVTGISETQLFLSQFINVYLLDNKIEFPSELVNPLRSLGRLTTHISEVFIELWDDDDCGCNCEFEAELDDEEVEDDD